MSHEGKMDEASPLLPAPPPAINNVVKPTIRRNSNRTKSTGSSGVGVGNGQAAATIPAAMVTNQSSRKSDVNLSSTMLTSASFATSFAGPKKDKRIVLAPYLFRGEDAQLPPNIETAANEAMEVERAQTVKLEALLEDSWNNVEHVMELNKSRVKAVQGNFTEELKAFRRLNYWDDTSLRDHFDLTSILDADLMGFDDGTSSMGGTSMVSTVSTESMKKVRGRPEAITVKRSYFQQRAKESLASSATSVNAPPSSSNTSVVLPPPHTANPYTLNEDELLDPMNKNAPIRRLFAPIIRNRSNMPIECTILLNEMETLQKKYVPLEEEMNRSMFNLPLHLPFRSIADYIQRTLGVSHNGANMEKAFEAEHKPIFGKLKEEYQSITNTLGVKRESVSSESAQQQQAPQENNSGPRRVPRSKLTTKESEHMWKVLIKEGKQREELQPRCLQLVADAMEIEQRMESTLVPAQEQAASDAKASINLIKKEADQFTADAIDIVARIKKVKETGQASYDEDKAKINEKLKSSEYLIQQSQQNQEKCARRVREAMKEFVKEQRRHEQLIHDHLDLVQKQEQLDAAFQQFRICCDSRAQLLKDAEATCRGLDALVGRVEGHVTDLLDQTQKHVQRTLGEEVFRKVRVSKRSVENAMDWYRCIGDISYLHQGRYDSIMSRVGDSWHLNYLLEHEKTAAANALEQCRVDLGKVDKAWHAVGVNLASFQIPIPSLSRLDKDPLVVAARTQMVVLDTPEQIKSRTLRDPVESLPSQSVESTLPPVPIARRKPTAQTPRPPARAALGAGQTPTSSARADGTRGGGGGVDSALLPHVTQTPRGTSTIGNARDVD